MIGLCDLHYGYLGGVEFPFIAIISSSTQTRRGGNW